MSDFAPLFDLIKEKDAKYVDLRFADLRGKWQHLTYPASAITEELLADGIMFDGSSIAGWKEINESDMGLRPDPARVTVDPFAAQSSVIILCDVFEPDTGETYPRCPRGLAKRAEAYLNYTGIGDTVYVGPEAEFFVFDDVRFEASMHRAFYYLDSVEAPHASGRKEEAGNIGHRPPVKGGYFPVPPVDSGADLRAEMLSVMGDMGLAIEKHHHEVAPSQHELGCRYNSLVGAADDMQIYKYVVHNVAHSYGKTATFMPKPVKGDNGSGMHVHQSIWKAGKPLFAGTGYADLSESALYYIGGIIRHARALNAFTNPLTNSYKRLVPGFEAPVLLAYSARNRSASCRIPHADSPKGKRVEVRFPDPGANPYFAFAAMLMAGLDGIETKAHPGDPIDKNLYDLPPEELKDVPTVCGSLRQALEALDADRAFLKKGGVFTDDLIDAYLALKWEEVKAVDLAPHPIEFQMYYSV
ncbi:MAG TPA: type I glutamate--ammonia ligase [Alphaproteobacteria bacterium]|nr:type I glutamate--ammonia ligase [Alphaproteobacteria bacterium]